MGLIGLQKNHLVSGPHSEEPWGSSDSLAQDLFDDDAPLKPLQQPEFTLALYHPSRPCSYILRGDAYAIGRDQTNAIRINNRFVSRRHAYLVRVPNQSARQRFTYCLIDGNRKGQTSTNGVFVNGRRVATHYLQSGDVIHFGPEIKAYFFEIVPVPAVPHPFDSQFSFNGPSA